MKNLFFLLLACSILIGAASCETALENAQNRINNAIDKQVNKADSIINVKVNKQLDKADSILDKTVDKHLVDSAAKYIDEKIVEPIKEINTNL